MRSRCQRKTLDPSPPLEYSLRKTGEVMAEPAPMLPALQATLDRVRAHDAKRESAKIYQFPFWPEPDRGIPNEFSRSALFAATQARHRKTVTAEVIASQDGYVITYTGQRLDQTHLDVYEA